MPGKRARKLTKRKTFRFTPEDIKLMDDLKIDSDTARDLIREGMEKIKRFKI